MALDDGGVAGRLSLTRFSAPQPGRTVVLAWRTSSPHVERFEAFARVVEAARP